MVHIQKLFENGERRVGVISAHPDDELSNTALALIMQQTKTPVHGIILSKGEASTKNYPQKAYPNFSVGEGDRITEGIKAAQRIGLHSIRFAEGKDGMLLKNRQILTSVIATWALDHELNTFVTLGLTDHIDHEASNLIAHRAAQQLYEDGELAVDILSVQHFNRGNVYVQSTAESRELAGFVAEAHASQIRTSNYRFQVGNAFLTAITCTHLILLS